MTKNATSKIFEDSEDFDAVELVDGHDENLVVKRTARVLEKSINISVIESPQKLGSILDTGNLTETIGQFQRDLDQKCEILKEISENYQKNLKFLENQSKTTLQVQTQEYQIMIDKQRSEITKLGLAKLALQTSAQKISDQESKYSDQLTSLQKKYSELADSKISLDSENQLLRKKWVDQGEALTNSESKLEKLQTRLKKAEQTFSDVDEENVKLKERYEDIIEENLVSKRKFENLETKISTELASKDQESQNIIDKLNSEFEKEKSQQQQDKDRILELQTANKRLIEKNEELEQILSDLEFSQKTTQESLSKLAPAHADLNSQVTKYEKMMVILSEEKETIE